mgnify:CR=1 FL=1
MEQKEFTTRMNGAAVRERMKELKMTKADLIRAAGISAPTLQRALENRSVRMTSIVAICHALELDESEDKEYWETDYYRPKIDKI